MLPKIAEMVGDKELRMYSSPMEEEYHSECDETPLVDPAWISKYRSMLGCAQWVITLGRFDIAFAVNNLARYSAAPREGHIKALKRVFGYLRSFPKGKIIVDPNEFDRSPYPSTRYDTWDEFYPGASEELPPKMPVPKGKVGKITVCVDADHARDLVTRRSVTGILLFVNNTPIKWISKRQKTVETSTYGSELIAARIAVELILEYRITLRMLGVPVEETSYMLGDNMSVVLNTTIPSSFLKKKHNAIAYHRVREAIAAKIVDFAHIPSKDNIADLMTKPLSPAKHVPLCKKYLFCIPKSQEEGKAKVAMNAK